jgi:aminoglycoside phosphotransferase (APT) family kinase protein
MELLEVLEKIKEPEKLIDPREVDLLLFWVSGWIGDYEEQLAGVDQRVAVKYDSLAEIHGSDAAGKRKLALEPVYTEQREIERRIRQLKAFKSNLRRRYEILTNKFN